VINMAKKPKVAAKKAAQPVGVLKEGQDSNFADFLDMLYKFGARVNVVAWSQLMLNHAENLTGVPGSELVSRSLALREAGHTGSEIPVFEDGWHFSTYAVALRNSILAIPTFQRKYMPTVVNICKMAKSYVLAEPLNVDDAVVLSDVVAQQATSQLASMLVAYLQRINPEVETAEYLQEHEFVAEIEASIKSTYSRWVHTHWANLSRENKVV